jgi:divalent metal cation (Fe/Co/Zn/Cd) transporter
VYDVAPLAVSAVLLPTQTEVFDAVVVTVGVGFTVTVNTEVFVQPFAAVPVTVYVVAVVGDTVTEAPVKLPGIQL